VTDGAPAKTIHDAQALAEFCAGLEREPYVAIDTEFLRDTTYWPILCLVQVAAPSGERAIIDPLPDLDLRPLFEFLESSPPVKVFHAARQDIEIFHHIGGVIPTPLYDTQIAAMACGYGDSVGYETLVKSITKANIDKSARFTDWRRRPLSEKQLHYAISDVTHLCHVYEALHAQLAQNGRNAWIEEDMTKLATPTTYDLSPENAWLRLKLRDTRPRAIAVAMELGAWREREAQTRDVPRGRILKDEVIAEVLHERPKTRDDLDRMRAIPRGWGNSELGAGLLAAVARGMARSTEGLPKIEDRRREPIAPARIDLLKTLLRARSEQHEVAQKLIATTADLEAFAVGARNDLSEGWRYEVFGRDAERLLKGDVALALKGDDVEIIER
jgi:ribonuclease D